MEERPVSATGGSSLPFAFGFLGVALAGVAELVDAPDLGSGDESCGGSSPSARTICLDGKVEFWMILNEWAPHGRAAQR